MARRRTSALEDIVDFVSSFPWWVGCALALILFLFLHGIANSEVPTPAGAAQVGSYAGKQLWVKMAFFGQFLLPGACAIGSLLSAVNQYRREKSYKATPSHKKSEALFDLHWHEFEDVVGEFFKDQGYEVKQKGGNGPDGGVDLVLAKNKEKFLVQCKQWKAYKVGVQTVRELYGVMASQGATGGFVITSGEFTVDARHFAEGLNIQLINGAQLHQMIRQVHKQPQITNDSLPTLQATPDSPFCPECGEKMIRRTARRGPNIGKQFWGCANYPQCKGVRPV